jgi:hypothetical protein
MSAVDRALTMIAIAATTTPPTQLIIAGEIRCFHAANMFEAQATRVSGHRSATPDTYR